MYPDYLEDILTALEKSQQFVAGMDAEGFEHADSPFRLADQALESSPAALRDLSVLCGCPSYS